MQRKTYQERTLYGTLIVDLTVCTAYFLQSTRANSLSSVVGAIFSLTIGQIVVQAAIAARTCNHLQDERDVLIRLRGYRAGYVTFVSCVVMGLGALWLQDALVQIDPGRIAVQFLGVMFGMLVLSDVVRAVTQLSYYWRSA